MKREIAAEIKKLKPEMVDALAEMVARPAVTPANGGDGETAKAEFVESLCRGIFDGVERRDAVSPDGARPNVVARCGTGDVSAGRLWVIGHLDVVPPGDRSLWKTDPFRAVVKNGRVYGRGAEDNGQAVVAAIFAVKALVRLGLKPPRPICFAAVADEETGSYYGIRHLVREKMLRRGDVFLVPDGGSPDGALVEVAEKGILWLRIETAGRQCHASRPAQGINAMEAASALAARVGEARARFSGTDSLYEPPVSTFAPTRHDANVPNINTIPGTDRFFIDCRVLPCYPLDEVIAFFRGIAAGIEAEHGVRIKIGAVQELPGSGTDPDSPLVGSLTRVISRVRAVTPRVRGVGWGTCAAFARRAGHPAVVWGTVCGNAHQPNEFASIANMVADAELMAHFFLEA